jgi:hypothetical protein
MERGRISPEARVLGTDDWGFKGGGGFGLGITAARTPRIAPWMAVHGRGYVARIKGISASRSGSRVVALSRRGAGTGGRQRSR